MARPRSGPESPPSGTDTPFIKKGEIWVPGTDVLAPGAVVNNNNNEAKTGTIRIDFGGIGAGGAGAPIAAGARPEVVGVPVAGTTPETPPTVAQPDIEALTKQMKERLQGQFDEQLNDKVTELRGEFEAKLADGEAKIGELTARVTELETQNQELRAQNDALQTENARLQAELDALQNPTIPNLNPNVMTNEDMVGVMQQLVAARDDLAKYTIRRTGRITDRFLRRRREDKVEYTNARDRYTALLEQVMMFNIQEDLDAGHSEEDIHRGMVSARYSEHAAFAIREVALNDEYWDGEIARGGWRKWRANGFRRWANLDTKWKIAIGLTIGIGAGAATAGLGLGLFGLAAGAAARSSLGLLNHQTSIRNVTQKSLNKELSKIEQNRREALRNIGNSTLADQARLAAQGFGTEHDSTVRHRMNRNRLGTALWIGSGALGALGIADAAGVDVPSVRGWWGSWEDHGRSVSSIDNHTGGTGTSGPTGPEGVTGNGGVTSATGAEGTTGTGGTGATGTEGSAGGTGTTGPEGAPGNSGPTGATGAEGATGTTGAEGTTGTGGTTGATGTEGSAGGTGTTGAEGTTGSGGVTGTESTNGATDTEGHKEFYNPIHGNESVGVKMPDGTHLLQNADGSYKITDNNGNALAGLDQVGWDTQGNLDKATRAALRHNGFELHQDKLDYTGADGLNHQHYITVMEENSPEDVTGTGQVSTTTSTTTGSFNPGGTPSYTGIPGMHDLPLGGIGAAGSSQAPTGVIGGIYDGRLGPPLPPGSLDPSTTLDSTHRKLIGPLEGQYRDYLNPDGYHAAAADLPHGYHFGKNALGGTNIFSPEGYVVVENVETTKTGALAPWVIEKIKAYPGLDVGDNDNHELVFKAKPADPEYPGNTIHKVTSVLEEEKP